MEPIGGSDLRRELLDLKGKVKQYERLLFHHSQKIELMESTMPPIAATPPAPVAADGNRGTLRSMIDTYEKKLIEQALNQNRWHRSKVASLLGVDRKTLFTKMKRHGLLR